MNKLRSTFASALANDIGSALQATFIERDLFVPDEFVFNQTLTVGEHTFEIRISSTVAPPTEEQKQESQETGRLCPECGERIPDNEDYGPGAMCDKCLRLGWDGKLERKRQEEANVR